MGESNELRDADAGGKRSWVVIEGTSSSCKWWIVLTDVSDATNEPRFTDTRGASHRCTGGFATSGWRVAGRSVGVDRVSFDDGF